MANGTRSSGRESKGLTRSRNPLEELTTNVIDALTVGVVLVDPSDFRIMQINRAASELFGVSASRLAGRLWADSGVFEAPESALSFLHEIVGGARGKAVLKLRDGRSMRFSASMSATPNGAILTCQLEPFLERAETAANQRTRDSLHRLAAIIESSRTAVITTDANGVIDSWNSNAEVLFGYESAEAVGRTLSFLTPVELAWEDEVLRRAVMRHENLEGFETYRQKKDGSRVPVSLTVAPLADNVDGGLAFLAHDISHRRRVEEDNRKLFKELNDLRFAIDASTIVAITNSKGVITFVNDRFCDISGYAREELIGKTHRIVNSGFHPKSFFEDLWQTISGGRVWRGEIRNQRRDGSTYWVDSTIVPLLDEGGFPYQYVALRYDITERKEAERERDESRQRMRLATIATGVGLWEWNIKTNEVSWDDQMFKLYGIEPTEDGVVDYEVWRSAVHPDEVSLQEEMLQNTVRRKGKSRREFRIRRQTDGDWRNIQAVETARIGESGEVEWVVGTNVDITDRKRAVRNLQHSEEIFRSMVEASAQIVWRTDAEGNLLDVIDWSPVIGLSPDGSSRPWEDVVHPDDRDRVWDAWGKSIAGTQEFELEYRVIHTDGSSRDVVSRAVPIFENRKVREWIGAISDVTAERQALASLRESESRFRQLTEGMPQLIWTCEADDGRCDYLSPQWVSYTGIDAESQLGYAWLDRLHPDDRASAVAAWNAAWASSSELVTEFRIQRYDGVYRWFHTRAIPLRDSRGEIVKWFGSNTDIDDRKRAEVELSAAERRFRATFEQAAVGIAHVAVDGTWLMVNERLCQILGYDHSELLKSSFQNITHTDDVGSDLEFVADMLAGEISTYSVEKRYVRKDGSHVWTNVTVSSVTNEDGEVLYFLSVIEDISRRKQAELAVRESEGKLRLFVEYAPAAVAMFDKNMCYIAVSRRWKQEYGLPDNVAGRSHYELFPNTPDEWKEIHVRCLTGVVEKSDDDVFLHLDGRTSAIKWEVRPWFDSLGDVGGLMIFSEDITDRKRREFRNSLLNALNEKLIASSNIDEIVNVLGVTFNQTVRTSVCAAIEVDQLNSEAFVFEEWLAPEAPSIKGRYQLSEYLGPKVIDEMAAGHSMVVDDVMIDDRVENADGFQALGIGAFLNVPMLRDGELVFVLGLYACERHVWQPDEIEVMEEAASRIWNHLERRRVEQELRAEQSRIDKIAASSPSMICSFRVSHDGNVTYPFVSPAIESLYGVTAAQLAVDDDFIESRIHPEDRPRVRVSIRKSRESMSLWNEAYRFEHPGKGEIWVESFATPVVEDDGGVIWHGIVSDITARKTAEQEIAESEKRYRLLFETNPLPMWVYDLETLDFLAVNDAAVVHYGYSRKEFLSMKILDIRPTEDLTEFYQALRNANNSYKKAGRFRHRRKDASIIDVEIVSHGIYFDGRIARLVLANDITEQVAAERKISELNESLEQKVQERTAELNSVNRELESFSYSVSHDLRAPLRAMDGFSLALIEDYGVLLDSEGQNFLNRIRLASQKMAQLIDDLLKLSRVSRGEIFRSDIDLTKMVNMIADQLQEEQPRAEVELKIAKGVRVYADERLIRVALENLLGNAWKFTSKKSPARIVFGRKKLNGRSVLYLSDNGAGFDMAFADKLFGAFQRLHSTKEFEGTGIGLATVQRIINRHGGSIWAESKPEKGTTFYFTVNP